MTGTATETATKPILMSQAPAPSAKEKEEEAIKETGIINDFRFFIKCNDSSRNLTPVKEETVRGMIKLKEEKLEEILKQAPAYDEKLVSEWHAFQNERSKDDLWNDAICAEGKNSRAKNRNRIYTDIYAPLRYINTERQPLKSVEDKDYIRMILMPNLDEAVKGAAADTDKKPVNDAINRLKYKVMNCPQS